MSLKTREEAEVRTWEGEEDRVGGGGREGKGEEEREGEGERQGRRVEEGKYAEFVRRYEIFPFINMPDMHFLQGPSASFTK